MVAICVVPIGFMVVRSFGRVDAVTLDVEITGTLEAYRTLFSPAYRPVLLRSLSLAGLTVLMCLLVGLPAALAMSRLGERARTAVLVAVMLPSFVSFTVRIFAWQGMLATGGPVESVTGLQLLFRPPAVLIGMVTAYVPLFLLPAFSALSRCSTRSSTQRAISTRRRAVSCSRSRSRWRCPASSRARCWSPCCRSGSSSCRRCWAGGRSCSSAISSPSGEPGEISPSEVRSPW